MKRNAAERIGTTIGNFKILDLKRENRRTYFYIECLLCANKKWMRADSILAGRFESCGCYNKEHNLKKAVDIKNQTFGRLTAIKETKERDKNNGAVIWECKCSCGNIVYVSAGSLTRNMTRSCGCLGRENSVKNGKAVGKYIKENFCINGTNINNLKMKRNVKNTSGIKGVGFSTERNKWVAQIRFKGKNYYLGRFDDIKDAIEIRKRAEEELFGSFLEWYEKEKMGVEKWTIKN